MSTRAREALWGVFGLACAVVGVAVPFVLWLGGGLA